MRTLMRVVPGGVRTNRSGYTRPMYAMFYDYVHMMYGDEGHGPEKTFMRADVVAAFAAWSGATPSQAAGAYNTCYAMGLIERWEQC